MKTPGSAGQNRPPILKMNKLECILMGIEIGYNWAKQETDEALPDPINPAYIIEQCCQHFGMTLDEMRTRQRQRRIKEPRQITMYLLSTITKLSLAEIGGLFGSMNHATVIHARKTIRDLMDTEPRLKAEVMALKARIEEGNSKGEAEKVAPLKSGKFRSSKGTRRAGNRARCFKGDAQPPRLTQKELKRKPHI